MRVLIVDDHPVTREGLRVALGPAEDIDIVGEASTGEAAVDQAESLLPDLIFMDVRMPGMSGTDATKIIRERHPDTKVILFTVDESKDSLADAVEAGVSGYLLKDVSSEELVNAARLAMEGKAVIHPALTQSFFERMRRAERREETSLSPREIEILQQVAYGATTRQAADRLGISPHTVKTHLERIFEKLGANDRAQAVAIAIRQGLVE
ncbi:MAG: response regulator [Actinomycetota bacterium]